MPLSNPITERADYLLRLGALFDRLCLEARTGQSVGFCYMFVTEIGIEGAECVGDIQAIEQGLEKLRQVVMESIRKGKNSPEGSNFSFDPTKLN